ncbi:hypothetical protein Q5P01_013378 [Channa striata]|uniref:Uncharacterized protein n=1 Tax=Channa striata TaxID=64152 RepID=A0AA88SJ20_CHASR|nr:hypothetical protein Q5P01_013378 [Channa striata]
METSSGDAGIPSMEPPVRVTCEGVGDVRVETRQRAADADSLKLFGAGSPVSLVQSFPAWESPSQRKLPAFTSLGYSDRPHWVSGPGQEVLLSGSLATGCLVRLEDKDPDNFAVVEQPTVETEQGKQVLVAKCAFSEQRNDSYVLASVVAGTVGGADRNSLLLL